MKKGELIKIFSEAISDGSDIQVEVTIPGQNDTEYIINKNKSIPNKLQYYCETYNDDLVHQRNKDIRIIDIKKIQEMPTVHYESGKKVECENCGQSFTVAPEEKREYGEFGIPYVICPACNGKSYLEDETCLTITPENLKYPQHFAQFGVSAGAVHVTDDELEEWAKKALSVLLENKEKEFYVTGSGDSIVIGLGYEDEIQIIAARQYYEYTHMREELE